MRAAANLKLLAEWKRTVHLIVVPIFPTALEPEPEVARLCASWQAIVDPMADGDNSCSSGDQNASDEDCTLYGDSSTEWNAFLAKAGLEPTSEGSRHNRRWQALVTAAITSIAPDLIFVFRFYMAQFVLPAFAGKIPIWLDIDELESKSRNRFACMHDRESLRFHNLMMESAAYRSLETRFLTLFERIFAASDPEAKSVQLISPSSDIRTLPNIYPRISPVETVRTDEVFRILFVGTLGYQPNLDAITHFCSDILPIIRSGTTRAIEVDVIGGGMTEPPSVLSEVNLLGRVSDCSPYYARCDLSVVPLRSGGGTRIKILESFSFKRPVVSTSAGVEGLNVTSGVHLVIADEPEDFAAGCLSMIEDGTRRSELALKGHEFLLENHTLERLQARVAELFGA